MGKRTWEQQLQVRVFPFPSTCSFKPVDQPPAEEH